MHSHTVLGEKCLQFPQRRRSLQIRFYLSSCPPAVCRWVIGGTVSFRSWLIRPAPVFYTQSPPSSDLAFGTCLGPAKCRGLAWGLRERCDLDEGSVESCPLGLSGGPAVGLKPRLPVWPEGDAQGFAPIPLASNIPRAQGARFPSGFLPESSGIGQVSKLLCAIRSRVEAWAVRVTSGLGLGLWSWRRKEPSDGSAETGDLP